VRRNAQPGDLPIVKFDWREVGHRENSSHANQQKVKKIILPVDAQSVI